MKTRLTIIWFLFIGLVAQSQTATPQFGSILRLENFPSAFVQPRTIDIWLPQGYDHSKKYAVLYMHDGQMLFDSTISWNHQEWGVDETVTKLVRAGKMRDCIVVGIWNNGQMRHPEYFPQKPFDALSEADKNTVKEAIENSHRKTDAPFESISDRYLNFLVKELKPYIDSHFSTKKGRKDTFIAGSSMGGLISLYAICEYPEVFGGAACLSTHWTGIFRQENNPIPDAMLAYLKEHLPNPKNHRIYFDYGTATLDALYEPTQLKVDTLMRQKGFSRNWTTRKYEGQNHSERAWASRLDVPLVFLLGRKN